METLSYSKMTPMTTANRSPLHVVRNHQRSIIGVRLPTFAPASDVSDLPGFIMNTSRKFGTGKASAVYLHPKENSLTFTSRRMRALGKVSAKKFDSKEGNARKKHQTFAVEQTCVKVETAFKRSEERDASVFKGSLTSWAGSADARPGLTTEEELSLSADVQDLLQLQSMREELAKKEGRTPTPEEWADYSGITLVRLYARIGKGRAAKRKMVAANLLLVDSVAKQFRGKGLSHTELCQEGALGLLRSTEKYDTSRNTKFSSFAFFWIRQRISAAAKKFQHVMRISRPIYETVSMVLRHKQEFQMVNRRDPTLHELAVASNVNEHRIQDVFRMVQPVRSMEGDSSSFDSDLKRQYEDETAETLPWLILRETEMKTAMAKALETLAPREQMVIRMRYGFDSKLPLPRSRVASELGLSFESIRLCEKKALNKLQQVAKEDGFHLYFSVDLWAH